MDWLAALAERRIREATARGEFDDLPGAGKPLDLRDAADPDWWLKRFVRREGVEVSALLPPALALRREAERLPATLADLTDEDQVRSVVEDFNARVRADWRRPGVGSSQPWVVPELDVDALVSRWREGRTDR